MEATAAFSYGQRTILNMKLQAFVAEMVLDDDASTELTSHCLREMAENMLNYEWPVDLMEKRFQNQR
jgi:hypothetical protein